MAKIRYPQYVYYRSPDVLTSQGSVYSYGSEWSTSLTQETFSEGHSWPVNGYQGRDEGGSFYTRKYVWEPSFDNLRFTLRTSNGLTYRDGTVYSTTPRFADLYNQTPAFSNRTLDSWGTTAVSNVLPTKSKVDIVTSGIELAREGLPALIGQGLLKSKLKDYREIGGELLNYEFGVKPLLGDLQGVAKSIVAADKRIKQLERDSGKLVRRRFRFPDREESFITNYTGASATPSEWTYSNLWNDYSRNRREERSVFTTKRSFSGAFTYYLNLGERQRSQLSAAADNARFLLGVKLDVETVWNLAPWTWLADWFGNVGDIMTNISHFGRDGLVMPYGYVMAEQSAMVTSTSRLFWFDPSGPDVVTDDFGFIRKQRHPANPFGFGLSDLVLDSRQTSILAALGITRAPRR